MRKNQVVLYGVAESPGSRPTFTLVAVSAIERRTGYKLMMPDQENERINVMRAFHHSTWIWKRGFGNRPYLDPASAIEAFVKDKFYSVDCLKEQLAEARHTAKAAVKFTVGLSK